MSILAKTWFSPAVQQGAGVSVRWILGGLFAYMGLSKALHPVEFLKVLRQYEAIESSVWLNVTAAALPWFEVFCGLLLVAGIAVRGTGMVLVLMLIPFSVMVLRRALDIHESQAIPFCSIRFDCGCGAGVVVICHKLAENALLALLATLLVFRGPDAWCLRHALANKARQ